MALSFLDNVDYRGKKPNFTRDLFETIADMVAFSENYLPDVFIACNKEDGNLYIFNRNNTVDTTFGKWRQFEGDSTGSGDWDSLIGKPFKDIDGNVFTVDENGVLSIVIPEVPIEVIKVNDVELDIDATDKSVNVVVPTLTSELTNDSEFVSDADYIHTDNNFTTEEKDKLELLENYDDSALTEKIQAIEDDYLTSVQKEELVNSIAELDTKITDGLEEKLDAVQSVDNVGKFLVVGDDGTVTFAEPSATSGDSAENIAYVNTDYSQYSNVDLALDALFAKVYYVKPTCSLSASPTGGTFEMGVTITAPIVFNWTTNKDITTQTLTGCTLADETVRTATYDTDITSDKTFTLSVSDGENSATSSVSYKFMNNVFWGSASTVDTYDSTFIGALSNKKLTTSVKGTYSFNITDGEYGFWAVPSNMTISTVWIGGFEVTVENLGTVSYTNAQGYTRDYNLYKTSQSGLGSISAEIK